MSDFKIFQLNKKAKFLSKTKDAKSKRNEQTKSIVSILSLQKNIRAFLTCKRQSNNNNPLFIRDVQSLLNQQIYKHILSTLPSQPKILRTRFILIFLDELSKNNHPSQIKIQMIIQIIQQQFNHQNNKNNNNNKITTKHYKLLLQHYRLYFSQSIFKKLMKSSQQFIKAIKMIIKVDITDLCDFLIEFKDIKLINQLIKMYYYQQQQNNNTMQIQPNNNTNLIIVQQKQKYKYKYQSQQKLLKSYYNTIFLFKLINQQQQLNNSYIIKLLSSIINHLKSYYILYLLKKYNIDQNMYRSRQFYQEIMEIFKEKKQWQEYQDVLYHLKDIIQLILLKFINKKQFSPSPKEQYSTTQDTINILIEYTKINQSIILMDINIQQFFNLIQNLNNKNNNSLNNNYNNNKQQQFQIKNYSLFITIMLLQKYLENINDLKFIQIFQYQKQNLGKVIKEYLIRFMKNLISFDYQRFITGEIVRHFTSFMNNLYNKIFRTKLLNTKIFQDPSFRILQGNYGYAFFGNNAYYAQMVKVIERSPYLLPIQTRFLIFKQKIRQWNNNQHFQHGYGGQKSIIIHRGNEFKDAFDQLYHSDIRRRFHVKFINQFNQEEIGMDAGGLTKQLLTRVFKQAFSPKFGRFIENNQKQLMPNPIYENIQDGKIAKEYEFIGRLLGKCLLQNIMLGMKFAGPFLNLLINKKNTFDELLPIDPQLYKSLVYITQMQSGIQIQQLQLTFQYQDNLNKTTKNLKPHGNNIKVTLQNKIQYINLLVNYKVNKSFQRQTNYIRRGLKSVINQNFIKVFNYAQFNYLLSGEGKIDVADWKKYSKYSGEQVKQLMSWFWEIVFQYSQEEKSLLLKFVTSCERPSFLGFKDLHPQFTIRVIDNKDNSLPLSHTCSNVLDLPRYDSKQTMKQKLTYAIKSGSGFQMG